MTRPAAGSMRIPIISAMKSFRPVNRYFASATAARNESTIASTTVIPTMMTLFLTASQKPGWSVESTASRKWSSVGLVENQVGVAEMISVSGLKAVEIIQKTGKI